jgi:RimJ/RimL family protein N-acetyltransferase
MANDRGTAATEDYEIQVCSPDKATESDLNACLEIVKAGTAVDPESAAREIRRACMVAVARKGCVVVGTGAIKRHRPGYAKEKERQAGVTLASGALELGYIAIESSHQGRGLSNQIISRLLAAKSGPLFATTDDERMKRALTRSGFVRQGHEWKGNRGSLSLWIRE